MSSETSNSGSPLAGWLTLLAFLAIGTGVMWLIVAGTRSWMASEQFNSECEVLNRPIHHLNGSIGWRSEFGPSDGSAGEAAAAIHLENTEAGDDILSYIATTFPDIYELRLDNTQVSDEGLQHLHRLTSLTTLTLNNTQVTQQGLNDLQTALPGCTIFCANPLPNSHAGEPDGMAPD